MSEIAKRTRKSPDYAVELISELTEEQSSKLGEKTLIKEVQRGFPSPEKALEWAEKKQLQGVFRVVRIASEEFMGASIMPQPVYSMKKLHEKAPVKKGRKPKKPQVMAVTEPPTVDRGLVAKDDVLEDAFSPTDEEGTDSQE